MKRGVALELLSVLKYLIDHNSGCYHSAIGLNCPEDVDGTAWEERARAAIAHAEKDTGSVHGDITGLVSMGDFGICVSVECSECHGEVTVCESNMTPPTCGCGYEWSFEVVGEKPE